MKLSLKREMAELLARITDKDQWNELDYQARVNIKRQTEYKVRMGGLKGPGAKDARTIVGILSRRNIH